MNGTYIGLHVLYNLKRDVLMSFKLNENMHSWYKLLEHIQVLFGQMCLLAGGQCHSTQNQSIFWSDNAVISLTLDKSTT